jgi:hypothetical protein
MKDNTFEISLEIADMMWEVDRLKQIEQEYVAEELYEKAAVILERQKRLTRLINNKQKKLKEHEKSFSTDART